MSQYPQVTEKMLGQLPVYFQPWWLNIVCGEGNWKHIPLYNGNEEIGVFAIYEKRSMGVNYVSMPHFTPYMGPFLFYHEAMKESSRLSLEEKVLEPVIEMLSSYVMIEFNLLPSVTNIFPFYKRGFRNLIRYTYLIKGKKGQEGYLNNISQKLKKEIDRNTAEIREIEDTTAFFLLLDEIDSRKNIGNNESKAIRIKIDMALSSLGSRKVFGAFEEDNLLGGIYVIEDSDTNYLMFTGQDKIVSKSGVIAKLIDHAIKMTIDEGKDFDFEGSMIPGVERFFRRFGGELTSYHVIVKEKNMLFRIFKAIKKKFS